MFRLNDAVRCYQAQHQSQSETRCVAASVATLSPRARPGMTRVVATVAAVATPPLAPADIAILIEQLREEGALLEHQENALLIRPTHWQQVDRLSPHWKALLLFLQTNENGDDDGTGRSA
ncbi:hypothetical protein A7317_25000 [Pseudomonas fluorescens]|uniref:hypothetical protein n=1 Tax=Pseudomonas TaxID=286 RepID=UPI00083D4CD0|nr:MULTISPECIES: hypothetical protein [Pseudomonas]MDN5419602.1 hypothetical protein [Pseudomonadales bacterium]AOE70135.1 hypothetical protein A7317_25000 [Pseudomonas fluorescens]AOE75913.1 hypothetical protein A7319_24775 [Pseudomonas fluorescens]MDN5426909.1 hypothetical protein [Pseudomonadales bacterium]QDG57017.1 hypothetical protein NIBR502773_11005 [Pseudomonas sp. NIBRBAC000502773]